jgi:seryl-tRNA synthetase
MESYTYFNTDAYKAMYSTNEATRKQALKNISAKQAKQKAAREAVAQANAEQNQIGQLIQQIRKTRSGSNREAQLKAQIEALTGHAYYV